MPKYRISSKYAPETTALKYTFNRIKCILGDYTREEWVGIIGDHRGAKGGWTADNALTRSRLYFRYALQAGFIIPA